MDGRDLRAGVKLAMGWGSRRYIWQTLGSGGTTMLDLRLGILARVDVKRRIFRCILETCVVYCHPCFGEDASH